MKVKHVAAAGSKDPPPVDVDWRSKVRASLTWSGDPEKPEMVEVEEAGWNRCHAATKALEAGLGAPLFVLTKARKIVSGECDLALPHGACCLLLLPYFPHSLAPYLLPSCPQIWKQGILDGSADFRADDFKLAMDASTAVALAAWQVETLPTSDARALARAHARLYGKVALDLLGMQRQHDEAGLFEHRGWPATMATMYVEDNELHTAERLLEDLCNEPDVRKKRVDVA